jgi:hypothetical protein
LGSRSRVFTTRIDVRIRTIGIDSLKMLDEAFEAVKTSQPLNSEQVAALIKRRPKPQRTAASSDSNQFDATARHPEWLG